MRGEHDAEALFPIRLDDYVFDEWTYPRKADLIKKNIGDFRSWRKEDEYNKYFEKLLTAIART